jgi:hypothetical protein
MCYFVIVIFFFHFGEELTSLSTGKDFLLSKFVRCQSFHRRHCLIFDLKYNSFNMLDMFMVYSDMFMVYLLTSFTYLAPMFNSLPQRNQRLSKHPNCHSFVILHSRKLRLNKVCIFFRDHITSHRNPKEGGGSAVPAEKVGGTSATLLFMIVGNHKLRR